MKTTFRTKTTRTQKWHLIDAKDQILGRLAVRIAEILMGKAKPDYTPHVDTGDFIVVIHADKIKVTGQKSEQMAYHSYSGYHGGHKTVTYREMLVRKPGENLRQAVKRMLPKTNLGRHQLKKLKIYVGDKHPHSAQGPAALDLKASL